MNDLYDKFRKHVLDNSLIVSGDRVLLSVSAGKDSMAMLHMTQRLKDEISFETGLFHLNHMTRGAESDDDALFVGQAAGKAGLFCRVCTLDVNRLRPGGVSFEEFARDTRYGLLAETAGREGYNKIATAHTDDDNCETILMRVLSGTGIRGLRGIPAVRGKIIRPMLRCSSGEIYEYLELNSLSWREDLSNSDEHYLRNFVRSRIFPVILERFPRARQSIATLSRVSSEQLTLLDDTLEAAYTGYLEAGHDSVIISHPGLDGNIPAIRYLVSRELGERFGLNVSSNVLEEISRNYLQLRSNNVLYNRNGVTVRKRHRAGGCGIVICRSSESAGNDSDWEYIININSGVKTVVAEAGISLEAEESDFKSFCAGGSGASSIFLSVGPQVKSVTARIRMPGDRIKLETGTRKIKDLLIEKKLDSDMKKKVPIITVEGRIAACLTGIIPGSCNRISCNFSVRNDSERIIRINIKAENDI